MEIMHCQCETSAEVVNGNDKSACMNVASPVTRLELCSSLGDDEVAASLILIPPVCGMY